MYMEFNLIFNFQPWIMEICNEKKFIKNIRTHNTAYFVAACVVNTTRF